MRTWAVVSITLICIGCGLFAYKVFVLDYPLRPSPTEGTWRVELVVNVNGEDSKRTVVDALLPRTSGYQRLLSEEFRSGPMRFSISESGGQRRARWSGTPSGGTTVSYQIALDALSYSWGLPETEKRDKYPKSVQRFVEPSDGIQPQDSTILDLAAELNLDPKDKVVLAREIFHFVSRELGHLGTVGPMDATTVARDGRANRLGRARLFCALARSQGLPCQVVAGLPLEDDTRDSLIYWNEAYIGAGWVPFDAEEGLIGSIPPDRLALAGDWARAADGEGIASMSYRFEIQSEMTAYLDLMRRRLADSENSVDEISLLFLPLHLQRTLQLLLLIPLGALVISILRGLVGLRTFGIFMPMIISLSLTVTGLFWGTIFLASITSIALLSRLWIQRFYLLLVARIAFVLTLLVVLVVALMLVSDYLGMPTSGIGAFPFVIMTMIVERISVSLEEEGLANTLGRVGNTLVAIYITYLVIQFRELQLFLLVFPEFLITILGLLIAVGRYTGYRATELLFRYRLLAQPLDAVDGDNPSSPEGA